MLWSLGAKQWFWHPLYDNMTSVCTKTICYSLLKRKIHCSENSTPFYDHVSILWREIDLKEEFWQGINLTTMQICSRTILGLNCVVISHTSSWLTWIKLPCMIQEHEHCSLRSRGLCLMPIASTIKIARSNGADLWAPANASSKGLWASGRPG